MHQSQEIDEIEHPYSGELWIDVHGTVNFKFHVKEGTGGFIPAKEALHKFIDCIQDRIDKQKLCPFYESI